MYVCSYVIDRHTFDYRQVHAPLRSFEYEWSFVSCFLFGTQFPVPSKTYLNSIFLMSLPKTLKLYLLFIYFLYFFSVGLDRFAYRPLHTPPRPYPLVSCLGFSFRFFLNSFSSLSLLIAPYAIVGSSPSLGWCLFLYNSLPRVAVGLCKG